MAISDEELKKEKKILKKVQNLFDETMKSLDESVSHEDNNLLEFKKMMWENVNSFDVGEMQQVMTVTSQETDKGIKRHNYYNKLKSIKDKPYFASIVFKDDDGTISNIYMSLTYLKDKGSNNILYDWRSPICSLFYDYEVGRASYEAPGGVFTGELKRKRQYKIENGKLIGVFDNSLNIDDEVLQEVLATETDEKMKNVVNTIQREQNNVIRNLENNNLIVQGIAGSGKTTVGLHRIAFLLYQLKNLTSNNILIFSPNNIFTEYISDVLPSLGESNTLQTTFNDYLSFFIDDYKDVETYTDFVSRYYSYKEDNPELVTYKQSDEIISDLDNYLDDYISNCKFISDFTEGDNHLIKKNELNKLLKEKYNKFPLFDRVDEIALKLSENYYKGSRKKVASFKKLLIKNANFVKDYKKIYKDFFTSEFCKIKLPELYINTFINKDIINYEDALLYSYIKGTLEGFLYEGNIKQVVIDEAQDYNKLQYIIINKIFQKADFTILGDINQNINPYYKYNSLEDLKDLFRGDTKYIELLKTYRSSPEIIKYTNKILNLNHVNAIRRSINKPVIIRKNYTNLKESLLEDIAKLTSHYKSFAIITKDDKEALKIYELIKDDVKISLIDKNTKKFHKESILIPAYISKGLEFDSVLIYNDRKNSYRRNERNLLYVACTRCQHELIIYN